MIEGCCYYQFIATSKNKQIFCMCVVMTRSQNDYCKPSETPLATRSITYFHYPTD